ncbi:MAG TPA: 4'-phosphopantetheinyl transferase superfamily protein [Opitutales bacterium]|nr:4'-phosphopantetheinyl transferase superfamily protein [Opitutales bacterium]
MSDPDYTSLLSSTLQDLLPAGVHRSACRIPEEPSFEFEVEEQTMCTAGDYRKREFVAGRGCARSALAQAGFSRAAILPDEYGVPVWPEDALAAISHSRGYCAAIACRSADYRALGLDLEKTNRLSASAIARTVHPNEQGYVRNDQKRASLIFCAKEAFFKAQFPLWHTHGNFHDLEFAVDEKTGLLTIQNISVRFPEDLRALSSKIRFRFSYFNDFVVSVCWLARSD